ncbi:MAG: tRNA (N6-isopentenyl adenosine(37)-C2)-methylthiotransferase MiaB [Lachnospiraceae bacterium]|nr:tRNA (N6-isopentenyl adenosine(37)-C2)-methylthiotransferase MiaB [Lachnospiraceae bacterium]
MIDFKENVNSNQKTTEETRQQMSFLGQAKELVKERSERRGYPLTFHVTTFGCQMNARDSEKLTGMLLAAGYVEKETEDADFVIYNTCTVRENANNKVYGRLGYLHGYKKQNPQMKIALCGCMMQEDVVVSKIKQSYPFVDLIFGTHNIYKFPELLVSVLESESQIVDIWKEHGDIVEDLPSVRKYPFKSGVNIMYGCNNFCTYCIVPYVRGRERSRQPRDILRECERLVKDGVVEIMLLGQNVNSYGKTLQQEISFADLLKEVATIPDLQRIRFMTSHPKDLSDELIEVMASYKNICPHLHLPLQSGSDTMLAAMNRHYTKAHYLSLVDRLRAAIPDITLTTDIIVGFPGETEDDFAETMDVVERVRYDSAFTFIYSKRTGTPASAMDGQVAKNIVKGRFNQLLERVQTIGAEQSERFVGSKQKVLIEHLNEQDPSLVTGRMMNNSIVHLAGTEKMIGQVIPVNIKESKGFYYLGEPL